MSLGNYLPSQPNIHLGKLNQKPISITLVGTDDEFPEKGLWHLIFFRREVWPTTSEMCASFLYFYPLSNIISCFSRPPLHQLIQAVDEIELE